MNTHQNNKVSASTQQLVRGMIKSAKLSFAQQKVLDSYLYGNGGTFPVIQMTNEADFTKPKGKKAFTFADRNVKPTLRPRAHIEAQIQKEIALETSSDVRRVAANKRNFENEKLKLQLKFENKNLELPKDSLGLSLQEIDEALNSVYSSKACAKTIARENAINSEQELQVMSSSSVGATLVMEIEERQEFLEEMEKIGQGAKYRNKIKTEIAQRLARLEKLAKQM